VFFTILGDGSFYAYSVDVSKNVSKLYWTAGLSQGYMSTGTDLSSYDSTRNWFTVYGYSDYYDPLKDEYYYVTVDLVHQKVMYLTSTPIHRETNIHCQSQWTF